VYTYPGHGCGEHQILASLDCLDIAVVDFLATHGDVVIVSSCSGRLSGLGAETGWHQVEWLDALGQHGGGLGAEALCFEYLCECNCDDRCIGHKTQLLCCGIEGCLCF